MLKSRKWKINIMAGVVLAFLIAIGIINAQQSLPKILEEGDTKEYVFDPIVMEEPKSTSVSIVSVGDVLIHSAVYEDAQTGNSYNFKPMFELIQPYIEQADIAIANSETIIGGSEIGLSTYPCFNSPYELGDDLKATGFDVVSMANNHTLDRGEKAIQNAIAYWNKIDVLQTGSSRTLAEDNQVRLLTKNNIIFSFLSYTYGTNGIPIPDGKDYLVNLIDKKQIKKDVQAAKKVSDVVAVSMHFGNEYQKMPSDAQLSLAQYLADLGVNIVFGAHPHVLQPVDWIIDKDGNRTYVIYSAGNFISAQDQIDRLIGGAFGIDVKKVEYLGETWIELENPTFLPIYTYYNRFRNFKLYPLESVPQSLLNNQARLYEESVAHVRQYLGDELKLMEKK